MHHSGVAAGLSGHRAIIPADTGRASGTDALGAVSGAARVARESTARFTHADSDTRRDAATLSGPTTQGPGRHPSSYQAADDRHGAPSSAYLAQHIAQEVEPLDPGFDSHQAGARAYIFRRDSTVEILSSAPRLDVYI